MSAIQLVTTVTNMKDQKTFLEQIGTRIADTRKATGFTQTDLAEAVNLSQQVIANYEAGQRNIPVYTLARIADALSVPVAVLTADDSHSRNKRGPAPRIQKQLERIQALPKDRQKFVIQALEMALQSP